MWRTGTVVALHDETATARTITLAVPDWPGHVAGQHVGTGVAALWAAEQPMGRLDLP